MQARSVIAGLVGVWLLAACQAVVDQRGHVVDEDMTAKLHIGSTTKQEIMQTFGSPSSTSTFGEETWYYIQQRKVGQAFLRPEITEQKVTQITFDSSGVVKTVNGYGLDDKVDVAIVGKQTPTEGHSLGFFEQTLGNLGRFNAPGDMRSPSNIGRP